MSELAWEPTPEYVERANVTRLMRAHGIGSIDELRARSVEDVEWYWDAVVKDLGIPFATPYQKVLDASNGVPWATWFTGGRVNLVANCVDRWAEREDARDRVALIGESETGDSRSLTFAELRAAVDQVAAGLRESGVGKGDSVAVFMPMVPEAGDRRLRDREDRRRLPADLLRLRARRRWPRACRTPRPRWSSPPTARGAAASTALMKPVCDEAVASSARRCGAW